MGRDFYPTRMSVESAYIPNPIYDLIEKLVKENHFQNKSAAVRILIAMGLSQYLIIRKAVNEG